MFLLVVNFHYVGCFAFPYESVHSLSPEAFGLQLDALARIFTFVSLNDLLQAQQGAGDLPEKGCLITFDDGLRCQYDVAVPALRARGIPAAFFVCGRPLAEHRALHVHKIHWLRAHTAPEIFLDSVLAAIETATQSSVDLRSLDKQRAWAAYRYDTEEAALIKYLLNHQLPAALREQVIHALFIKEAPDEEQFCERWYMTPLQVQALAADTLFAVGAHGYSHQPLAALAAHEAEKEICDTLAALQDLTRARICSISYPSGHAGAVGPRESQIAGAAGFVCGFTMERSFNRTLRHPLLLARIDANDAPGGHRPLIRHEDDTFCAADKAFALARRQYFLEETWL